MHDATLEQCTEVNTNKVVINIILGSVFIQTVLGGLTIYPPVTNVTAYMHQKIRKLVKSRQSHCNEKGLHFLAHSVYRVCTVDIGA